MCCREGVDKAKPPKSSFVSTASLVNSSQLLVHAGENEREATAKKSAPPSALKNKQGAEIETINLASGQTLGRYDEKPPKAFESLNCLHGNVIKGRTAPAAIKKQPSFNYVQGGQPQSLSFNEYASAETSSDKPSSDYDAGCTGDLPSPSALLGKPSENLDPPSGHASTGYGSILSDDLPSPSALVRQNDAATGNYHDKARLKMFDISPFNDDDSEIEAAMIGLSDAVTMQEDSQIKAAAGQMSSQADAFRKRLPPLDESTPKLYHGPAVKEVESSGTSRLFFSTESPEKVVELGQKRKVGASDEAENLSHSAPVPKRPKVSDGYDQAPRPSSSTEGPILPSTAIVKPGQPAWVYEFDPAFIAEWQDIVDFV